MERSFETAQDRLVKGLRVAGAKTLEEANAYLEAEYLPEWNAKFTVVPACADDAHRKLGAKHDLAASLSEVDQRVITNDYTIRHNTKVWQIARGHARPRMRGAAVRVESRRNGEIAMRFEGRYVQIVECKPAAKSASPVALPMTKKTSLSRTNNKPRAKSQWMKGFYEQSAPSLKQAIKISNATS